MSYSNDIIMDVCNHTFTNMSHHNKTFLTLKQNNLIKQVGSKYVLNLNTRSQIKTFLRQTNFTLFISQDLVYKVLNTIKTSSLYDEYIYNYGEVSGDVILKLVSLYVMSDCKSFEGFLNTYLRQDPETNTDDWNSVLKYWMIPPDGTFMDTLKHFSKLFINSATKIKCVEKVFVEPSLF